MTRYAVIGASSGTGLALVQLLDQERIAVRAISRHPPPRNEFVEPVTADVTDAQSISDALWGELTAVFYTVDIHGLFNSRRSVRAVMYDGFVNTLAAVSSTGHSPKMILLSVIGAERGSWVWGLLNGIKRGMQQNVLDREQALKSSRVPYVICRAPKLGDQPGGARPIAATPSQHKLDMKMGISRSDLARAMWRAAQSAPVCSTWDIYEDPSGPTPPWLV